MKAYLLAILLTTCGLPSVAQDTTYFTSDWKPSLKAKAAFYRVIKKEGAEWMQSDYFVKNNQLQMRGKFSTLTPEIKNGEFVWYFDNGQVKHKGLYIKDKPAGQHLWYNADGKPDAVENYKNGVYEGNYEEYYANGKLRSRSVFEAGKQHGWTTYYEEDGSKQSEGNFKNGNRDGEWKYYKADKLLGIDTFKTEYELKDEGIFLRLPNDAWHLTPTPEGNPIQYIFKRDAIVDSKGRDIIPAIMVWYTKAATYQNNLQLLVKERMGSMSLLIKTEKVLTPADKEYPLPFKNGAFYKTSYTQQNEPHVLYLLYFINKKGLAFQIGLDMTKDINGKYDAEFWETIKSLKEF